MIFEPSFSLYFDELDLKNNRVCRWESGELLAALEKKPPQQ